jgi:metal-responsive CopG/Arc/MetJ family transcriptional regulator
MSDDNKIQSKQINIKMDAELLAEIDRISEEDLIYERSTVIRQAIRFYIKHRKALREQRLFVPQLKQEK